MRRVREGRILREGGVGEGQRVPRRVWMGVGEPLGA